MRVQGKCLGISAQVLLLCCACIAQDGTRSQSLPLDSIVNALEKTQAITRPQVAYRVIREYRLFEGSDTNANSDVVAEIDFTPPARKQYRIQKATGSGRGSQVIRRVLDHEIELATSNNQPRAALNRENYDFTYVGEEVLNGQRCYILGLKPKRKEKDLITGQVWVDGHSFFARQILGEVTKTPSWWLRKIQVKFTFADFAGTWFQSSMEAVADVRILGKQTLTSRTLDYRSPEQVAQKPEYPKSEN